MGNNATAVVRVGSTGPMERGAAVIVFATQIKFLVQEKIDKFPTIGSAILSLECSNMHGSNTMDVANVWISTNFK